MGKPSVTPPTVLRRGEVTPPTMGKPFVVSSTVLRSLPVSVSLTSNGGAGVSIPSEKSTSTVAVVTAATSE